MSDELIASERLELPLLSLEQLDAIADGDAGPVASALDAAITPEWVDEVRWLAGFRAKQLRERPQDRPMAAATDHPRGAGASARGDRLPQLPLRAGPARNRRDRLHAAAGCPRKGYALEAVRAAFDWATREHGVRRFRASVAPDNERSLNLIGKLGFVRPASSGTSATAWSGSTSWSLSGRMGS